MSEEPEEIVQRIHAILDAAEFDSFLADFQDETDRAAAVLGGAYLDAALERLLKKVMAGSPAMATRLLDQQQPLGTFGARTLAALAFGYLSEDEFHDLDIIRKIRNEFAHRVHGLRFADSPVSDWTASLRHGARVAGMTSQPSVGPRVRFNWTVGILFCLLALREAQTTRARPASSLWWGDRQTSGDENAS